MIETPVRLEQNYTKKKANISRIKYNELYKFLEQFKGSNVHCIMERPMVNSTRFNASISAVRSLESTLIIIEQLGYSFEYIDSKQWQTKMLGIGFKGPELKTASADIGKRLFPQFTKLIDKHKDADGLLIAEYYRKTNNK